MNPLLTLFLCGDVMLGRGVDQLHAQACDPTLHESNARDARDYVELAEDENGAIRQPVAPHYVWGDALAILDQLKPAARIINLESAITTSDQYDRGKDIHYRTHPANVAILKSARIDVTALANNHVLDWGRDGLSDTLATLNSARIAAPGAGADAAAAQAPAVVPLGDDRRLLVFSCATTSAGVPAGWSAGQFEPGIFHLPALNERTADTVATVIRQHARDNDLVVVSIHWGGNWGYAIPPEQIGFARHLIDHAGVDIIHGHSSHHIKGIEIYNDRLILYGAGDFINDYEGLDGKEDYRPDLRLMYLPDLDPETGALASLKIIPLRVRRMRLERAPLADIRYVRQTLTRESTRFNVRFEATGTGALLAHWR
jgi:poly-gamma-glutamate capsule biosynthesis protein CapA/YwtB (metallophosphatase superfamily)